MIMQCKAVVVLTTFLAVLGIGCAGHEGHEAHEGQEAHPAPVAQNSHGEDHDSHAAAGEPSANPGLVLHGAEKWQMDEHTRTLFSRMAERLEGTELEATTSEALKASGVTLRKDIDDLIAGCTMVGDAHNELHKFLTAYIPAVNELAQSGDPHSAERVRELLGVYPEFFE
jgi:hypothetical protein